MSFEIYTLNQIGARDNVEDAISPKPPDTQPVFIVCDGVGGNNFGEVASKIAVESFFQTLSTQYININNDASFKKCVGHALFKFSNSLLAFIDENPTGKNASTTLTTIVIKGDKASIAWCGDSRIYHIRNGHILYRTKDHSLVQELLNNKVITENEAANHPQKNVITKSLHAKTSLEEIETHEIKDLKPGDFLLLCTDGLMEQCTEEKLKEIFVAQTESKQYDKIIEGICGGRTQDNYSMILVKYSRQNVKRNKLFGFVVLLLVAAATAFFLLKPKKGESTTISKPISKPVTAKVVADTTSKQPNNDTVIKKSNFKSTINHTEKKNTIKKNTNQ